MPTAVVSPIVSAEQLAAAYSYPAYRKLIDELLADGKTTGPEQSEALTDYTRLNLQRMRRLDKTTHLLPAVQTALAGLRQRYVWLIITEGWCGDASQIVPVLEAIAQASGGKISTHYVLRDEHPALMDRYLTNGARAIPKLVVLHPDTLTEVAQWGPRPAPAQKLLLDLKAQGATHEQYAEQVHAWYAHDKTQTTQGELLALLQRLA
ncbi:Thiol-disulfide isomerase or thioredoxin [Hymenobacter daecheongensis DSM 21074]|uniref:Thiol-disulfide isomerase or thioredoxin n=1 Tax=Hymenobacter daecheongensis DSM 21074 TaxID=1121955 RepID=A0A1M6AXI2_9BACT|nr:thioredoxin family protein [Hymenobacter daecheongensis]SHI41121.1 Thiol-disulfide isomerase or thioredoxin [Hymenobacter daecheongensis DSM 21074]